MAPQAVIADARTALSRETIRQFVAPQFCRYGNRWHKISDLIQVRHSKGVYTVLLDEGREYIRLKPRDAADNSAIQTSVVSVSEDLSGFGPRLDPAAAPDSIAWSIEKSSGVEMRSGGLVFRAVSEVPVGMFFAHWLENMGSDCQVDLQGLSATMDLRRIKDYANAAGINIDLDPEAILATDVDFREHGKTDVLGTWVATQAAEESTSNTATIRAVVGNQCQVSISRTCLIFDLSDWGPAAQAYLWLHGMAAPYNEIRMHRVETFLQPITAAGNYSRALAGQLIGTDFTDEGGNWIRSDDVIAGSAEEFPASKFNLGLRFVSDTPADPGEITKALLFDSESYLEVILEQRHRSFMGVGL